MKKLIRRIVIFIPCVGLVFFWLLAWVITGLRTDIGIGLLMDWGTPESKRNIADYFPPEDKIE